MPVTTYAIIPEELPSSPSCNLQFQLGYNAGLSLSAAYSHPLRADIPVSCGLGSNDMPYNLPNSGYLPPKLGLEDPRARPRQPPYQQKATRRAKVPVKERYETVKIGATIDFEYANTGPPSVSDLLYHLDLQVVNSDVPIAYTGNMHCIIDWPGMNTIKWDLQTPFRTRRSITLEIANTFKRVIQDQAQDRVHGRQNLDVQKDGMHLFNVQLDRLYLEKVEYVREWDWWCARFSYEV